MIPYPSREKVADRPHQGACTEASLLLASSIPSAIPLCVLCAFCGETVVLSATIELRRVAQYRPHSLRDCELMRRMVLSGRQCW